MIDIVGKKKRKKVTTVAGDVLRGQNAPVEDLQLARTIGVTISGPGALAVCSATGRIAHPAGALAVVYHPKGSAQTQFLTSSTAKPISCLAFSPPPHATFLAAGESGHQPAVLVWEVESGHCLATLKGHRYGIRAVAFSGSGRQIISAGVEHDGQVFLWDWRSGAALSKHRCTDPVLGLSASLAAQCFVTAGAKHVKFWNFSGASAGLGGIDGKIADMGDFADHQFVDIAIAPKCPPEMTPEGGEEPPSALYCITSDAHLCYVRATRKLEKFVDLTADAGLALAACWKYVACACAGGLVRVFAAHTLTYQGSLPLPAPEGKHGISDRLAAARLATTPGLGRVQYPDAIACAFSSSGDQLVVSYSDHSLFVWDTRDMTNVGRLRSYLAHSSTVWGVVPIDLAGSLDPQPSDLASPSSIPASTPGVSSSARTAVVAPGMGASFATCSTDGSVRVWDVSGLEVENGRMTRECSWPGRPRSVYCRDLVGVLYAASTEEEGVDEGACMKGHAAELRCLATRPDGLELATGDKAGNIRVYDLASLTLKSFLQAHDNEVLSLDFSESGGDGGYLLASSGRDRLIHVYDVNRSFKLLETIGDHSSTVTSVRFADHGSKLLSSGADKSVLFRHMNANKGAGSCRYHEEVLRGTVYDLDVDPTAKHAVTVGQDKKIHVWTVETGRSLHTHKTHGGEAVVVSVDPSGSVLMCCHVDRTVRLYNILTGALLAKAVGHAEVIPQLTEVNNSVWRVIRCDASFLI